MFKHGLRMARFQCSMQFRRTSSSVSDAERIERFLDPKVQSLLKVLTGRDFTRIFRNRKVGQKLHSPKVSFMTEEGLEETIQEAERRADALLQMPPVLLPKDDKEKVLAFDPRIQGHDESAFVFTDISLGSTNRERLIVIRDLDGTLRHADQEVRMKMNNIYFPYKDRAFFVPKMFSDPEVMQSVLDRASKTDNTYEFILDRACTQFDPDDPQYISVVERTYDHINEMRHYDFLKSTRHYGPLVFYLTRTRKMDNLLLYNIQKERISTDAVPLISLFTLLFPESKSRSIIQESMDDLEKIRHYIELDSIRRSELELSLAAYEESKRTQQANEKGLQRAHGF